MEFKCPACSNELSQTESSYYCIICDKEWVNKNNIPNFIGDDFYWGEIPQAEMQEVNRIAIQKGWKASLEMLVMPKYPRIYEYITNASRADWRFLLPIDSSAVALDVGSGWGSISFLLSKACSQVYSVECVKERIEFQQIRSSQDGTHNIKLISSDIFNLPFKNGSFDLIVMNGLLEWVGLTNKYKTPREAQLKALQICYGLLKENNYLYIGIENRFGYPYFLGAKDHSGLRFTSLMPRWLADTYCKFRKEKLYYGISSDGYRTYTYSYWGYIKLLREAGFRKVQILYCIPSYNDPRFIVPLDKKLLSYFIKFHSPMNTKKRKILNILGGFITSIGAYKAFPHHFSIIATK